MRRSVAVIVMLALSASMLGLATSASSVGGLVAQPPGSTADTGSLSFDPASVDVGGKVKVIANFPSGVYMVKLYKESATTPGTWSEVASDESNSSGNAYMYDYQVDNAQNLYARITSGGTGRTEVRTLTPTVPGEIGPTGPDTGDLTTDPATFTATEKIKVVANFPDGVSTVKLYKEATGGKWDEVATDESNAAGNAYFYDYQVTEPQRLFARKSNGDRTEIDPVAPSSKVSFDMQRDCSGNNCGTTATATGVLDPAEAGRVFTLQRQSGSSWVTVTGASPTATDADGKVEIDFPLAGIPQYTARIYRLTSPAVGSSPAVTSPHTISFMPGPAELGKNVLRVDVEGGKFPTSKGLEYPATATASQDGVVNSTINNFAVEEFGVRGTSTAGYTKRPYKLKFEDSPVGHDGVRHGGGQELDPPGELPRPVVRAGKGRPRPGASDQRGRPLDTGQPVRGAVRQRPVPRLLPHDRVGQDRRRPGRRQQEDRHDHGGRQRPLAPPSTSCQRSARSCSPSRTPTSARRSTTGRSTRKG